MSCAGGLVPLLVLLVSRLSAGVPRHLSPWEAVDQTELLLEEAVTNGLLAPPAPLLDEEDQLTADGDQQQLTYTQFQSRCELVGHTQRIQVPGCAPVELTVNACDGSCGSYAQPSSWQTLSLNPLHVLTSVGQCCNIMETKNVSIKMECIQGPKHVTIKSAKSCACFHCKKT